MFVSGALALPPPLYVIAHASKVRARNHWLVYGSHSRYASTESLSLSLYTRGGSGGGGGGGGVGATQWAGRGSGGGTDAMTL